VDGARAKNEDFSQFSDILCTADRKTLHSKPVLLIESVHFFWWSQPSRYQEPHTGKPNPKFFRGS